MSDSADAFLHIIKDVIVQGFVPTFALCTMIFYVLWSSAREKSVAESDSSSVEELVLNAKENLIKFIHAKKINLLVLHGSNGLQSSRFAEILCDEAEKRNMHPLMIEADDIDFECLPALASGEKSISLAILVENHPNCTPPENSTLLFEWVTTADEKKLSGINFAVFGFDEGLLNEDTNAVAKKFDTILEKLDGNKIIDIGHSTCKDVDLDTSFEDKDFLQWTEDFLVNLKKLLLDDNRETSVAGSFLPVENLSVETPSDESPLDDKIDDKTPKPALMIFNANDTISTKLDIALREKSKKTTIMHSADVSLDGKNFHETFKEFPVVFCIPLKSEQDDSAEKVHTLLKWIEEGSHNLQDVKYLVLAASNADGNGSMTLEESVVWAAGNLWEELNDTNEEAKPREEWLEHLVSKV